MAAPETPARLHDSAEDRLGLGKSILRSDIAIAIGMPKYNGIVDLFISYYLAERYSIPMMPAKA